MWIIYYIHKVKKVKVRFTYTARLATYAASTAMCVTDRAVVHPRSQLKPVLTRFGTQPHV